VEPICLSVRPSRFIRGEALIFAPKGGDYSFRKYRYQPLMPRSRGMDRIRPKLGHCEIKLSTSVFCKPTETRIPRTTYSRPWSSALLIHQDLPALAGPAVALCTNFAVSCPYPQTFCAAPVMS
jgi:hypothetical protein